MKVDVAIIGAGTAGLNARREAEKAGKSYVLIEEGPYGTTCARVGCMPSKLLIAAADAAHGVAEAATFGVEVDDGCWRVNDRDVMERVRAERDRFVGFVVESTEQIPEAKRRRGHARFTGPNTLVVDDEPFEFDAAVVAVGSRPRIPDVLDEVRDDVLTNDEIFELETLPRSLAIFGTGVIGLELGQALARLGVKVCFFNPFDSLGFTQDPVVTRVACQIFNADLNLNLGIELEPVRRDGDQFRVKWRTPDGESKEDTYHAVFAAAGRIPNTEGLGLPETGAECDGKGHPAHWDPHTCRVGETAIYVAGDATGYRPILHEASDEGRIAGANAARHPNPQSARRRVSMGIAFTDPNMGFVGRRWREIQDDEPVVGEVSFADQGRARVMAQNRGVMRVYANRDGDFIGSEFVAPRGEHLAHLLAWSIQGKHTITQMLTFPFYHPCIEEGLRTALRDAAAGLRVDDKVAPEDRGTSPAD